MPAHVEDVAAYALRSLGRTHTFKLQKILYYLQAWTVVATDEPLYDEKISAFENGPVVRTFWKAHEGTHYFDIDDVSGDPENVPIQVRPVLDEVLAFYGQMGPRRLIKRTHDESPWVAARKRHRVDDEITLDAMCDFYAEQLLADDASTPFIPSVHNGVVRVPQQFLDDLDDGESERVAAAWGESMARARAALARC